MDIHIANPDWRSDLDIGVRPHEHAGIVEDLTYKHAYLTIERLTPQPLRPGHWATCLPAALEIADRPGYEALVRQQFFAGGRFVRWLLQHSRLTQQSTISAGCLVLYFSDQSWKHAGKAESTDKIISKWGTFLFFRHAPEQVPSTYGNIIRAFEHPGGDHALQLFREYAAECMTLDTWAQPG